MYANKHNRDNNTQNKASKISLFISSIVIFYWYVRVEMGQEKRCFFFIWLNLQDFGSVILESGRLSRGNVLESALGWSIQ